MGRNLVALTLWQKAGGELVREQLTWTESTKVGQGCLSWWWCVQPEQNVQKTAKSGAATNVDEKSA